MTVVTPKGCFITATDTNAGKTWVALGLIAAFRKKGYTVHAFKPVASGCEPRRSGLRNLDALALRSAAGEHLPYDSVNPYAFEPPIAPHIAAREAGTRIDLAALRQRIFDAAGAADAIVVEGIGGWLVPLHDSECVADLAALLQLPVILVVGLRLGCINHALMTAALINQHNVPFLGWVANTVVPDCPRLPATIAALRERLGAPLLATVPRIAEPRCAAPYLQEIPELILAQ